MNERFRWVIIILGVCVALIAYAVESTAQSHEGLMYGKVYTQNQTYTGPIRWGSEEVLWTDLFNASKTTDKYKRLVPDQKQDDSWLDMDWSFSSIWKDKVIAHQFACQFGNLSQVTVLDNKKARLKFKNGEEIIISGEGYNDIGSKVQVLDAELGLVSINWDRISKVEFLPTPAKLNTIYGLPLYGTVEGTRKQKFTGFIVWDNDERLTSDLLDGDSGDGKVSIKFSEIASIEREGRGSLVTLKSGRELYLTGSNDVNAQNRGVFVVNPSIGIVKVSWQAFKRISFTNAESTGPSFNQFTAPVALRGTVSRIDKGDLKGRIVYDIDESADFELIEGKENDIEYMIPLRNIKKIIPKNFDYSLVELTSGQSLLLGGMRDVSSKNAGLLVFEGGSKEPKYVSWEEINEITFN